MDDSSCIAETFINRKIYIPLPFKLKKKKKDVHMFYLIYFLLTVVALTAVWAKGGDLL